MVTPNKPTEAPAALILSRDFPNMALVHGSLASVQPKQWFLLLLLAARPFQLLKYKELRHQLWPHIIVEDQQLYFVHERLHHADLLPVAARVGTDLPIEVELEALGELLDSPLGIGPPEGGEVTQHLTSRHVVI
ncbi:hypothetical protein LCGC14_2444960, partial [marine sediment metagenome]